MGNSVNSALCIGTLLKAIHGKETLDNVFYYYLLLPFLALNLVFSILPKIEILFYGLTIPWVSLLALATWRCSVNAKKGQYIFIARALAVLLAIAVAGKMVGLFLYLNGLN